MKTRSYYWLFVLLLCTVFLMLPATKAFLVVSMTRFMIDQIFILLMLGYLSAKIFRIHLADINYLNISSICFFSGTILFWMIPHSLDVAAQSETVGWVMQINLFLSTFLMGQGDKKIPFIVKITLGIYLLSMLVSMGMLYHDSTRLICASFSLPQQWAAGRSLLWLSVLLFILFWAWEFFLLWKKRV